MRFSSRELAELYRRCEELIEAANDPALPLTPQQRLRRRALAARVRSLLQGAGGDTPLSAKPTGAN